MKKYKIRDGVFSGENKRNKEARVVKITEKQYAQPHDRLVCGYKRERKI